MDSINVGIAVAGGNYARPAMRSAMSPVVPAEEVADTGILRYIATGVRVGAQRFKITTKSIMFPAAGVPHQEGFLVQLVEPAAKSPVHTVLVQVKSPVPIVKGKDA